MAENLSVCMIVKNEENYLDDCLNSIKDVAGEIIVVDTGSSDSTIEIAKSYGAIVIETNWEDDFSKARNIALDRASREIILSIDADERLLNPDELDNLANNLKPNIGGWLIEVVSEKKDEDNIHSYVSKMLRLFRNHPEIRFYGAIHEQIFSSITKQNFGIEDTSIKMLHIGYDHSQSEMQRKKERNLTMLNKAIEDEPDNSHMFFHRGKTFMTLKDIPKALQDFELAMKYLKPDNVLKPQVLNYAALAAYKNKDNEKAFEYAEESLEIINKQAFANLIIGDVHISQNRFDLAYESYKNMIKAIESKDLMASIVGDYYPPPEQIYFRLGKCMIGIGQYNDAFDEFEKGIKHNPNDVNCLVGLANVAFKFKKYDVASDIIDRAKMVAPHRQELNKFQKQINDAMKQHIENEENKSNIDYSKRPLLSLCMIVKNEEEMLPGCLDSVKNLADEIIIVDTGSNDRTKEIAKKYGSKLYDFNWIDDFAAARNHSLNYATGQWILYLDADERITPESANMLKSNLITADDSIGGLICIIESDHFKLDGSSEIHRGGYPRIFRNYGYPKIQFKGRVHEQITPSILALRKSFAESSIVIQHLGYNQSREVMEQKIKRNYRLLLDHVKEEPLNGYAWYQLGQTLGHMQLNEQAEEAIKFSVQCGNLSDSVYASAAATLAQMTGNKKNFKEALDWANKSLELAPNQVYALNIKGYALLYLKRPDEAKGIFLEVLSRLEQKKYLPQSGFDIVIPEKVVTEGLEKAEKMMKS